MVTGWRRVFCTSIPKKQNSPVLPEKQEQQQQQQSNGVKTPRFASKFGFFSNPSTPRLQSPPVSSQSLRCRTISNPSSSFPNDIPKHHCRTSHFSNPSSPKSASGFSLHKATLRLSKVSHAQGGRCGICLQSMKTGRSMEVLTAECSHSFHFPCIAGHVKKQQSLICPVCSPSWKEPPLPNETSLKSIKTTPFRVYNDDEPLASPVSLSQFNPIPESETENDDVEEEFQRLTVTPKIGNEIGVNARNVEVSLLEEAATVAVGRSYESYVVVMKVHAPTATRGVKRAPIDLVTVLDVGGSAARLQVVKRAMRLVISLLNDMDRLSIVVFSSGSKRLLPLKRMSSCGRRYARRIVDALGSDGRVMSVNDALKKAVKVLEDRREKNAIASVMILSNGQDKQCQTNLLANQDLPVVSTTRLAHSDIPLHSIEFGTCTHAPKEDALRKIVNGLLSVVVQDVRLELGFVSGSAPAKISSVYALATRPALVGPNSVRVGDLHSGEGRELLVELKVPVSSGGAHREMAVRSAYRDPFTLEMVYSMDRTLLVPRPPQSVRSSSDSIGRLRSLHVSTRAVAESRRLIERNDFSGAHLSLASARALLMQSGSSSAEEFIRGLETELAELNRRRQRQRLNNSNTVNNHNGQAEEKAEPLTPTSAWKAAERLAKVAIMRRHMNRVGDLHGFENARF